MPRNEIESHPFFELGKFQESTKLILGSFPVYECTNPDSVYKRKKREIEETVFFYYGSCSSRFWGLYKTYIDSSIKIPISKENVLHSLKKRNISISDIILSCERKNYSSLDSDLTKRKYNILDIEELLDKGVTKILCTSKGVMQLLETKVLNKKNRTISTMLNKEKSIVLQEHIITTLSGQFSLIKKPIARVYQINKKEVEIISIPSPGSPQRQLKNFGFDKNKYEWRQYADNYFEYVFNWLKD
jgi:hypothetical protein